MSTGDSGQGGKTESDTIIVNVITEKAKNAAAAGSGSKAAKGDSNVKEEQVWSTVFWRASNYLCRQFGPQKDAKTAVSRRYEECQIFVRSGQKCLSEVIVSQNNNLWKRQTYNL